MISGDDGQHIGTRDNIGDLIERLTADVDIANEHAIEIDLGLVVGQDLEPGCRGIVVGDHTSRRRTGSQVVGRIRKQCDGQTLITLIHRICNRRDCERERGLIGVEVKGLERIGWSPGGDAGVVGPLQGRA